MEQWLEIRERVLREGVSKRHILRDTGMHRTTLEKILHYSSPPGYRRSKPPDNPKVGPYLERIRQILKEGKRDESKAKMTPKTPQISRLYPQNALKKISKSQSGAEVGLEAPAARRALIADDEGIVIDLLDCYLRSEGHGVEVSRDGRAALGKL